MYSKEDTERLLRRQVYASNKDVRIMTDAIHNACVEIGECGDLIIAGKCDELEHPFELIRACSYICELAGHLGSELLARYEWEEEQEELHGKTHNRNKKQASD